MNFGMRHFSFVNAKKITPKIIEIILVVVGSFRVELLISSANCTNISQAYFSRFSD